MLRSISTKALFAIIAGVIVVAALIGMAWDDEHQRTRMREHASAITGGDPRRGEAIFIQYGCGSCHTANGVRTATGMVGPPLDDIALRSHHRWPPREHARQHGKMDPGSPTGVPGNRDARSQRRRDGRPRHHRLPLHPREIMCSEIAKPSKRETSTASWQSTRPMWWLTTCSPLSAADRKRCVSPGLLQLLR